MVTYRKIDISEESPDKYLKGMPAIPDLDEETEKPVVAQYVKEGYASPELLPERLAKPPATQKTALDKWVQEVQQDRTLTGTEGRRKKHLKILMIRYIAKYASNPYKYIAHPKQIRNLPAWFEDSLALFGDKEMTPEQKKGVRTYFHDLIRWRDSQVGTPQGYEEQEDFTDEMTRQYGMSASPYNPQGLTPEETDAVVGAGEIKEIDLGALQEGVRGKSIIATEPEGVESESELSAEPIAMPEYSSESIFEEGPPEVEMPPEPRMQVRTPTTVPEPAPMKVAAPGELAPPRAYADYKTSVVGKVERPVSGGITRGKGATSLGRDLAAMVVGSGKGMTPGASTFSGMGAYSGGSLESVIIGSKQIRKAQSRAHVRSAKKKSQKAKMVGIGTINIGDVTKHVGVRNTKTKTRNAPIGRVVGRGIISSMTVPRLGSGVRGLELPRIGGMPKANLGGNVGRGTGTVDMMRGLVSKSKRSFGIESATHDITRASRDMMSLMPKVKRPIKRVEGQPVIKESAFLKGAVSGMTKTMTSSDLSARSFEMRIPDMGPVEYDFRLAGKLKYGKKSKVIDHDADGYIEYLDRVGSDDV